MDGNVGDWPNETPQFGQTSFGSSSFQLGAPGSNTVASPQFSSTFGGKPSGSLQFSTPTSTPAFGTSFNFNSPSSQATVTTAAAPSFGFSTPAPAYSFGGPTPGLFSQPTTQSSLFQTPTTATPSFGLGAAKSPFTSAPTSGMFTIPSASVTSSGAQPATLNFGAPTPPAASTFGISQPTVPKMPFGTSTGLTFGATPITTAGLSFGLTSTAATPKLSFGPSVASTPLNFGGSPQISTASTALNFSTPKSAPQTGLSFAPSASASLTFATPTTSQGVGLGFSAVPTTSLSFPLPTATTTSAGLNFGTSTAAPSGFSIQPTSTAPPSLGTAFAMPISTAATTSAPQASATLTFGTTSLPATTIAVAPTLSFPLSAPSTTSSTFSSTTPTTTASLSFGTPVVASSMPASTGLSFGLGGISIAKSTAASVPSTFGIGAQPPQPPPPARTVGLGGISSTPPKLTTPTTSTQAQIPPKEQPLPQEILQTVEQFKKFVQEQKNFSSEIARSSIKELRKVEADVDLINNCMNEVENEMRKNKAIAEKIKLDTAKGLQNAEMAQRTFHTPAGLQYENTAPFEYFIELSDSFEKEMTELKLRIESVSKHVKNTMNPSKLTPQDLALGMRRLHEAFVSLAGQLQSVHNQVEMQKEQYLNMRKTLFNDYSNVFETRPKQSKEWETILGDLTKQQMHNNSSPTPFNLLGSSQVQTLAQNFSSSLPTTTTLGAPITTGFNIGTAPTMPLFGSTLPTSSSLFNTSSSNAFQLQKPPVGNKRGKP
ncbi:nuclear pore complex protein Nup58 isoform X2 [Photinus pyralis]|uniref:Nucleoporin NSP1-like C-terminal domain-containing protein n=1 Tax=Photinus pyralis TaxID=7054 RepID=A0A1Y1LAG2_PHOPY|nr:nuclear pore complex protein Nup58 isoform X2 [Photinus pyralis]